MNLGGRAEIAFSMLIWGSVGIFARFSGLSRNGLVEREKLEMVPSPLKSNWEPLLILDVALPSPGPSFLLSSTTRLWQMWFPFTKQRQYLPS